MHSICIRNILHFSPINLAVQRLLKVTLLYNSSPFPPLSCASCTLCAPATFADCGFSPLFSFIHANIFNKFSFLLFLPFRCFSYALVYKNAMRAPRTPPPPCHRTICMLYKARKGGSEGGVTAVVCLECNAIASRAYVLKFFQPVANFFLFLL